MKKLIALGALLSLIELVDDTDNKVVGVHVR